jgi:hypothetical protein
MKHQGLQPAGARSGPCWFRFMFGSLAPFPTALSIAVCVCALGRSNSYFGLDLRPQYPNALVLFTNSRRVAATFLPKTKQPHSLAQLLMGIAQGVSV